MITSSFLVYMFVDCSEAESCWHLQQLSFQLSEACHVLYNVQSDDKRENELKDWCQDTDHIFPGKEY